MSIEPKDINVLCEHSNQYTTNHIFYYYLSSGYSNFIRKASFVTYIKRQEQIHYGPKNYVVRLIFIGI